MFSAALLEVVAESDVWYYPTDEAVIPQQMWLLRPKVPVNVEDALVIDEDNLQSEDGEVSATTN